MYVRAWRMDGKKGVYNDALCVLVSSSFSRFALNSSTMARVLSMGPPVSIKAVNIGKRISAPRVSGAGRVRRSEPATVVLQWSSTSTRDFK